VGTPLKGQAVGLLGFYRVGMKGRGWMGWKRIINREWTPMDANEERELDGWDG
jgi:hypothetical protein